MKRIALVILTTFLLLDYAQSAQLVGFYVARNVALLE